MTKTGLILEGGGMRGIYTAGILDVFMENGITFDGVIGVSAGAIHGCSYLSNQKGRSIRYYKKYCQDPRFMGIRSLIKTGSIVGEEFCYHEIPDKLDLYDHDAFLKCNTPFYSVCTNIETGKAEYCRITDMKTQIDYILASASLPYVSKIVKIDGKKYLDGGCSDAIPVDAFIKMGYEKNLVILTRDKSYKKSKENNLAGIVYRKYPKFVETLKKRHKVYNDTTEMINKLEKDGNLFVIRPEKPLNIKRLENDPDEIQRVYDIGYADGQKHLNSLKKWLSESNNQ